MMLTADSVPALPLWINGHAFLTCVADFYTLNAPATGEALRRVPLCGADEVAEAVRAAQGALAQCTQFPCDPLAVLHGMAGMLTPPKFANHFAKIIAEETGKPDAEAAAEVSATITLLAGAGECAAGTGKILALIADDENPLLGFARLLLATLNAGDALVLKPSPKAPSCALALTELASRAGAPDGWINLIHGDDAVLAALCQQPEIAALHLAGRAVWQEKVTALATAQGKPCVALV